MADELVKQLGGFSGSGEKPDEDLMQVSLCAPGRKALLPIGIAYHGPWKYAADGMGKHTREQVKALATTGLPIRLQSIGQPKFLNEELPEEVREVEYLENISFSRTSLAIRQFIFHDLGYLREQICPSQLRSEVSSKLVTENTIIYTSWERDRVFPQLIEELKQVAQVWVPCAANKEAFVDSGLPEHKVKVIPYPYNPASCTIAAPRGREDVPPDLRFYHIGKWEPRKNQHQMIGAFLLAFKPKDRASLLIKTSGFGSTWSGYPPPEESVQFWLDDPEVKARGWTEKTLNRVVRIITDRISDADIHKLHEKNNIYVSCGHGEAWDIPAFEAKLAGNRLVYMGYGGPEDYAETEDVWLRGDVWLREGMGPVHSQYDWETDAQWGAVSTEDFAEALLRAKPPEIRVCPPQYARQYSYSAVGCLMEAALLEAIGPERMQVLKMSGGFG